MNLLKYFIFTHIIEIFITKIYLSFVISIYIAIYLFVIQFYFFLIPGLYKHENIYFYKFIVIFLLYNILIYIFFLTIIFPKIWYFFNKNNIFDQLVLNINLYFEPKFNEYFFFCFYLLYIHLLFYIIFYLYIIFFSLK